MKHALLISLVVCALFPGCRMNTLGGPDFVGTWSRTGSTASAKQFPGVGEIWTFRPDGTGETRYQMSPPDTHPEQFRWKADGGDHILLIWPAHDSSTQETVRAAYHVTDDHSAITIDVEDPNAYVPFAGTFVRDTSAAASHP